MADGPTGSDATADLTGPTGDATGPTGDATGPTGDATGPTGDATGPTGDATGPTGMFDVTGPTGPVEDPSIATMDELMASFGVLVNKETADRATVATLLNQTRETLRAPLFQWAAIGFPNIWVIQSFTLDPPPICSDGASRNVAEYFNYCLGRDLNDVVQDIRVKIVGIALSMSFSGNTLRLHVSK